MVILLNLEFNDQKIDDKVRECKAIVCEGLTNTMCREPQEWKYEQGGYSDTFYKQCKRAQEVKEERCFNELKELDPESKYIMPVSPLSCNR